MDRKKYMMLEEVQTSWKKKKYRSDGSGSGTLLIFDDAVLFLLKITPFAPLEAC